MPLVLQALLKKIKSSANICHLTVSDFLKRTLTCTGLSTACICNFIVYVHGHIQRHVAMLEGVQSGHHMTLKTSCKQKMD